MNRFMIRPVLGLFVVMLVVLSLRSANGETPRVATAVIAPTSSTIHWHDSMAAGWQESQRRKLPMVIFVTSQNCHYCDAMKRDTWQDAGIRRRISDEFIAIELTPDRNAEALRRIGVKVFPITLVGLPEGRIVSHRKGYQSAAALNDLLEESMQHSR